MTKNSPGDDKGQGQISPFFFSSCCSEFRTRDVYLFKDKGQIINNDVSWPQMARLVGDFSKKKKTKKKQNTNPPVTPHLLFSQALALPSISDIVPGQWNLHLHITCQILRSTCKTILLSPDDTNLTRKPTNNTACHQSFIFSFKFLLVPSIYPPLCGVSRFQRLVRDGS